MRPILLMRGEITFVDDVDYEWLNRYKWRASRNRHTFYAKRTIWIAKRKTKDVQMHRLILGLLPSDKRECDHIDGNGLNNQRSNLRICTTAQNQQSSRKQIGCTSKYKGVSWNTRDCKWYSQIGVNKKRVYLGLFNSETEAAQAYDVAAREHYGEFALTNEMLGLY